MSFPWWGSMFRNCGTCLPNYTLITSPMSIIMTFNTKTNSTLIQKTINIQLYVQSTITILCTSQNTFNAWSKSSSTSYGLTVQYKNVPNKWNISSVTWPVLEFSLFTGEKHPTGNSAVKCNTIREHSVFAQYLTQSHCPLIWYRGEHLEHHTFLNFITDGSK